MKILIDSFAVIVEETRALLKIDVLSGLIVCIFLALFMTTVTRHSSDAALLGTFEDDEPLITMQLDGMTTAPYGNPANYLFSDHQIPKKIPSYWHTKYANLPYYGGLFLDLGFAIWMPLKLLGMPMFPTAPVILRFLTLIFSACTILAAFNTAKVLLGRWAAFASALFLLSNYDFVLIGTFIHPDSLMFFLMFIALAVAIRHAQKSDIASLISLGIIAGLVQGTKVGGPLLIPMTIVAITMGAPKKDWFTTVMMRGVLAALMAIISFFITTPYALVTNYYFDTWHQLALACAGPSPIQNTTFFDWVHAFVRAVGIPLIIAAVGACVLRFMAQRVYKRDRPLELYAILAATVFLWYASLQRFWVQPQYLVVAFCFVAALGGSVIDQGLACLPAPRKAKANATLVCLSAIALIITAKYVLAAPLNQALYYANWREDPRYALGQWAASHIEHGARTLSDLPAFFPEAAFPDQSMNNGPVRYSDLARVKPNYFVETVYHDKMWMGEKMQADPLDKWDESWSSMRLYQDLLGRDYLHPVFNADAVPGIQLIASMGHDGSIPISCDNDQLMMWKALRRWLNSACGPSGPQNNLTLYLFKLDSGTFAANISHEQPRKK